MLFSQQLRHCPNCGEMMKDAKLTMNNVRSLMCSVECLHDWELKYARMIMGKD